MDLFLERIRLKIPISPPGGAVVSETKIGPVVDSWVLWHAEGRETAFYPSKLTNLGGV